MTSQFSSLVIWIASSFFILFLLWHTFFIVKQQTVGVVETFGRFTRIARPGLNFKIPLFQWVAGEPSLRVMQLDVPVETKTKDNVFVSLGISVQYEVISSDVKTAFYRLQDPIGQIRSYIFDVVRARVPLIKLDAVFEQKDNIANAVQVELGQMIGEFGYHIIKALVTDIDPDHTVKVAMNRINEAERLAVAAEKEGEAAKIKVVKAAEAEAESKKLQGRGIADQRMEIAKGLMEATNVLKGTLDEKAADEAIVYVLMTQYFDALQSIGSQSHSNVLFVNNSPDGVGEISKQILQGLSASKSLGDIKDSS